MSVSTDAWRIPGWFPDLEKAALKKLEIFYEELQRFNPKVHLVSKSTLLKADLHHFADSILVAKHIYPMLESEELYDFGSGGGFPGIVYAALFPDRTITLVDSDTRKVQFLKHTMNRMSLSNASAVECRIERLPADLARFAISRAFAPLSRSLRLTQHVVSPGGVYFHMKSLLWEEELLADPTVCSTWNTGVSYKYKLPDSNIEFVLLKSVRL